MSLPTVQGERWGLQRMVHVISEESLPLRVFKLKPLRMSKSLALKAGRKEGTREKSLSFGVCSVEKQRVFHSEIHMQQEIVCFPAKNPLVKMHSLQCGRLQIPPRITFASKAKRKKRK